MEALDVMLTRRSVRKYRDSAVSQESVEALLRAAMAAPSAGDQQPWRFVVVKDKYRLRELAAAEPHGGMIAKAAIAVVVCVDLGRVRHEGFWIQDCSAATENLLLAAHALGLGAVWVGTYPREDRVRGVGEVLGLLDPLLAFAVVAIGHPIEPTTPVDRYDPKKVYLDRYEERT